jgi:hypothetical protein
MHLECVGRDDFRGDYMSKDAPVTVTLRIARSTKDLLKHAAKRDHRSMANMVEVLILRHCEAIEIPVSDKRTTKKST